MYMEKGPTEMIRLTPMLKIAVAVAAIMVVVIGIYPDPVISVCRDAAKFIFPLA
jgi:NADH:ubiquinone oxidoreductase subunit 2 (subunit N)